MGSEHNPVQELLKLRDRMNRLFEESMGRLPSLDEDGGGAWSPAVDIYEEADRVVLEVELPGIAREAVRVEVEEGSLILHGERRLDGDLRSRDFHRMERAYGSFRRTFRLPGGIDAGAVQADLKDGVLKVVLPRRGDQGTEPVRVPVT
jgi:HSP20 family protein